MKLPIQNPKVYDKDKQGKPLSGQYGPYLKMTFSSPMFPNEYLSLSFIKPGHPILSAKDGDEVELIVDGAPKEFNGKLWRNCKLPSEKAKQGELEKRVEELEARIEAIESKII